jgi:hypothetical protein
MPVGICRLIIVDYRLYCKEWTTQSADPTEPTGRDGELSSDLWNTYLQTVRKSEDFIFLVATLSASIEVLSEFIVHVETKEVSVITLYKIKLN